MEFLNVGALLERYEKLFGLHTRDKERIQSVIARELGIIIPLDSLSIKDGKATIRCGHVIKNEIFLKKERILSGLKESGIFDIG